MNFLKLKTILSKSKNKIAKKITVIAATVSALVMSGMIQFNAAVDFSGGVDRVTDSVISQGKLITASIFGAFAVATLTFTFVKGVKAALAYRSNRDFEVGPIIGGCIGTVVCGLASATTFFGWFGL